MLSNFDGNSPAKQEKVVAAKGAPEGEKHPVDRFLNSVTSANASEIDRLATRTAIGKHQVPGNTATAVGVFRQLRQG